MTGASKPDRTALYREYQHALNLADGLTPADEGESAGAVIRAAIGRYDEALATLAPMLDAEGDEATRENIRVELRYLTELRDSLAARLRFCRACGRLLGPERWNMSRREPEWCAECEQKALRGEMKARPPRLDSKRVRRVVAVPREGLQLHDWQKLGHPDAPDYAIPTAELSVSCSAAGPYHQRRGATGLALFVRLPAGWREDITPSGAEYARLMSAWPSMSNADKARRTDDGAPRQGRDGPKHMDDPNGRVLFVGRSDRPRVITYNYPPQEGELLRLSDAPRKVGHLELKCGCGVSWRAREATYSAAFDKLAAAGVGVVELRNLVRFA